MLLMSIYLPRPTSLLLFGIVYFLVGYPPWQPKLPNDLNKTGTETRSNMEEMRSGGDDGMKVWGFVSAVPEFRARHIVRLTF
jgi:hypothetical protein